MESTVETTTDVAEGYAESGLHVALVIAAFFFSLVGIVVNATTLVVMFRAHILRKSSIHVFIASLCCSDFLIGFSTALFQLQQINLHLEFACQRTMAILGFAAAIFMNISFLTSNANIFFISSDRASAALFPLSYKSIMTVKRATWAVIIAWTFIAINIAICAIFSMKTQGLIVMKYASDFLPENIVRYLSIFPLLVITTNIVLYIIIVVSLVRSSAKVHSSSSSDQHGRRLTRMVTMLLGILFLGNLPITVVSNMAVNNQDRQGTLQMWYDVTSLVVLLTIAFNNAIYVWQLPDFKKGMKRLLFCNTSNAVNVTS